jgi:hypothetical protein
LSGEELNNCQATSLKLSLEGNFGFNWKWILTLRTLFNIFHDLLNTLENLFLFLSNYAVLLFNLLSSQLSVIFETGLTQGGLIITPFGVESFRFLHL